MDVRYLVSTKDAVPENEPRIDTVFNPFVWVDDITEQEPTWYIMLLYECVVGEEKYHLVYMPKDSIQQYTSIEYHTVLTKEIKNKKSLPQTLIKKISREVGTKIYTNTRLPVFLADAFLSQAALQACLVDFMGAKLLFSYGSVVAYLYKIVLLKAYSVKKFIEDILRCDLLPFLKMSFELRYYLDSNFFNSKSSLDMTRETKNALNKLKKCCNIENTECGSAYKYDIKYNLEFLTRLENSSYMLSSPQVD